MQAAVDTDLVESIWRSPVASVISNPRRPDNPIEVANEAFCELTGYPEGEVIGRNCRFLAGSATEPWLTERIRQGITGRTSVLVDILNYRRDGTSFRNGVLVTPIFGEEGELTWFLGSQVELAGESQSLFAGRRERAVKVCCCRATTFTKRQQIGSRTRLPVARSQGTM